MARCVNCRKLGFFFQNVIGLCPKCFELFNLNWKEKLKVLTQSAKLVNKSNKADTQLSRASLCLLQVSRMKELAKEFNVLEHHYDELEAQRKAILEVTEQILHGEVKTITAQAEAKSEIATTIRGKLGPFEKLAEKLENYREYVEDETAIDLAREKAKDRIRIIEVQELKKDAEREEFKGNSKKAVEKYKEALYKIKVDDIDDADQQEEIGYIESRIEELTEK